MKSYLALKLISYLWKSDVRECERVNKSLKLFWSRTPNGSRELCSARATLRHQLSPAQNNSLKGCCKTVKWSTVRPHVEALSSRLLAAWDEAKGVLSQEDRWAPAIVPTDFPDESTVKKLLPKLNPLPLRGPEPQQ